MVIASVDQIETTIKYQTQAGAGGGRRLAPAATPGQWALAR